MSWDIIALRLPPEIGSPEDLGEDFEPQVIGNRSEIVQAIVESCPGANATDPSWITVSGSGWSVEISLGDTDEEVTSLSFAVRGSSDKAVDCVEAVLQRLHLRGIDSGTGEFLDPATARESFQSWQSYRDQILDSPADDE